MLGTTQLAGLYVGRLLIGLANGFFMTFSQLYIQVNERAKHCEATVNCLLRRNVPRPDIGV